MHNCAHWTCSKPGVFSALEQFSPSPPPRRYFAILCKHNTGPVNQVYLVHGNSFPLLPPPVNILRDCAHWTCNYSVWAEYKVYIWFSPVSRVYAQKRHFSLLQTRTGRRSWGTIVLYRERTEWSRTIPSFQKKNERIKRVLNNIGTICKGMERNGTENAWKERSKSGTRSYYQECELSRECILNQECVLNHLEIIFILEWNRTISKK